MNDESLTFASLFSGCGGFDLGFAARGFRSKGAFDWDPDAIENLNANIDGTAKQADLTQGIPDQKVVRKVDALIAGPPCQGFSTAGKRLVNDERNHLLTLTGELALKVSPKVLVVENVSGALSGEHARYLKSLDNTMRLAGYRTFTMRCQAADLGMAQLRRRVLLFAWRTGRDIQFVSPSEPPKSADWGKPVSEPQASPTRQTQPRVAYCSKNQTGAEALKCPRRRECCCNLGHTRGLRKNYRA